MRLGEKIRIIRKSKHMLQEDLAKRADTSNVTVSSIETGRTASPKVTTLVAIAGVFNMTLDELLEDVDLEEEPKNEKENIWDRYEAL